MITDDMKRFAQEMLQQNPDIARRHKEMSELMASAQTVADIVQAYRLGNLMPNSSPAQIQETERAIYAGCFSLLQILLKKSHEGGEVPTLWLNQVVQECLDYSVERVAMFQAEASTAH